MPSVIDTPQRVEYVTTHDLTIKKRERPRPRIVVRDSAHRRTRSLGNYLYAA